MNFVELLKSDHQKANEIIDRLTDTSDNAVRTRERLFTQLKREIETHSRIEEDQLYPRMRKHRETRDFVQTALEAHRAVQQQLEALDRMGKGDAQFLPRLDELKRGFREHVKAEEEEYLPAAERAFAKNEEQELSHDLEEERTRIGAEEMAEGGAEAMRGMGEAAARGGEAMRQGNRQMAEAGERIAHLGAEGAERASREVARQTEEFGRQAMALAESYSETAQSTSEDLQALMTCSRIAAGGMSDLRRVWMEWLGRALHTQTQASQELLRCTSPQHFVELQRSLVRDSMNGWLEGSAEMLRISHRIAGEALRPIEERVGQAAHAGNRPRRAGGSSGEAEGEQHERRQSRREERQEAAR